MNGGRKRSLAFMVATALVAVTTLLLGIYSVFDYVGQKRKMLRELDGLAKVQMDEVRSALVLPAWNIDQPQIEQMVYAMARPKSIYALRVTVAGKTFGCERNADWKLVPWSGKRLPDRLRVYDTSLVRAGEHVGDARMFVTPQFLDDDLQALRLVLIGKVILVDVVLVLAVYLMMSLLVLRPVGAIERYAASVSAGGHHDPPAIPAAAAELANLEQSIETMVHQLDIRHMELQEEMARRSESEDRFASIFDAVNDAIMLRDPETGAILDANRSACEMFGYTHDELLELPVGTLSSGEPRYTPGAALETLRSAGSARLFDWRARHRDGHLFWLELNMRLTDIGGEQRVILVGRDITERKKLEEQLRLAERLSAIGSLVAGVAHEVRNPLFGISATLEAFEAEFGRTESTAEYMTVLRRDVERLTRLMDDLLEYGRPSATTRNVQSIEPVIAEALRVCLPRAREKEVGIEPHVARPLPPVSIDADRMLQALTNVVENAIEFSSAGDAVVIDARAERNGASSIVFSISDHGPGFRDEDLPYVFDPFFTRRRGGSGLGLAIVQKIVNDHGGNIAAENVADGGARIEIRLPAAT
jgi:PAS domain S-box-containing protein